MAYYAMGPYDEVAVRPEPWQLKTAENAYTPYFVRADQVHRYSNVTWMLSTGLHYPSSYPPMTFEERMRAMQQDTMHGAGGEPLQLVPNHSEEQTEEERKAEGIRVRVEDSDSEEKPMGDGSFQDGIWATRKAPRTSTRVMELRSANRSSPKNSPIINGKDAPALLEASKIVKHNAKPQAKPHFSAEAPSDLSPSQKRRWNIAYSSLSKQMEFDPEHKRAYGELGRLTKLAHLMGRTSSPFSDMRDWLSRDV